MPIINSSVSVGTAATKVASPTHGSPVAPVRVTVAVPSGGVTVFFGGPNVTASNGIPVAAGSSLSWELSDGDDLYGVVASGSQSVHVAKTRS